MVGPEPRPNARKPAVENGAMPISSLRRAYKRDIALSVKYGPW